MSSWVSAALDVDRVVRVVKAGGSGGGGAGGAGGGEGGEGGGSVWDEDDCVVVVVVVRGVTVTVTVVDDGATMTPGQSVATRSPRNAMPNKVSRLMSTPPQAAPILASALRSPFEHLDEHKEPPVKSRIEHPGIRRLYVLMQVEGIAFEMTIWKLARDRADTVETNVIKCTSRCTRGGDPIVFDVAK